MLNGGGLVRGGGTNFEDLPEISAATGANFVESIALATNGQAGGAAAGNSIGRVYTATSLPSHIWSFNRK